MISYFFPETKKTLESLIMSTLINQSKDFDRSKLFIQDKVDKYCCSTVVEKEYHTSS